MRTNVSIPNPSLSNFSAISIIQDLMEGLGWQNMSSSIYQSDVEQDRAKYKLTSAIQFYLEEQNTHTHSQLIIALNETLKATQAEYDHAIKQLKYHQKQTKIEAEQKAAGKPGYLSQWSYWIFNSVKNFFGSTTEQQIEKYQQIAEARQAHIEAISHSLQSLLTNENNSGLTGSPSMNDSSVHFPSVIELASLNGIQGFKLNGENNDDDSGSSVSAAGDINGDGVADLVIGASGYGAGRGRSYVVFGRPGISSGGILNLSSLTGVNGFKLDGENNGDYSGSSVSAAGDINGDGVADLVIEAMGYQAGNYGGRSYVVFGRPGIGSSGIFALSNLTGTNGFKLDSENIYGDCSYGCSVSAAGDINDDGVADLVIGASGHGISGAGVGRSYMVFGKPGIGSSGILSLSGLTGINGFKLDGENHHDYSGHSVSAAGDINGDGVADLVIGAYGYPEGTDSGRSYVVFGRSEIGSSGILNLSSLTGANGFKLDGESYDSSGFSVSSTGDINGDGQDDLIIGAPYGSYYRNDSRSYVVFGGLRVGKSGLLNLSNLTGTNGFKLDGYPGYPSDGSGTSVSSTGDINGDGYDDLIIGAPFPSDYPRGCSYIVFGGSGVGGDGMLALSSLNGANGFRLDCESNSNDGGGSSVSTAGDINGDGVADLVIGGDSSGHSYVVFGDIPPILVNNSLSLNRSEKVYLSSINLAAFDKNHDNTSLVFIPTNITHGYFENKNQLGISLVNFTQQQVKDQQIRFIHDGSLDSPTYNITVRSSGIAWTGPSIALINFNSMPIILVNNKLIIGQNQTIQISTENLLAVCNISGINLEFVITNITHGLFRIEEEIVQSPVVNFSQQLVSLQKISFSHDGSIYAPGYQVSVNDSWIQTEPEIVNITFFLKPILSVNQFLVNLGQSVLLSLNNLCANDCYSDDADELRFNVAGTVTGGQFENTSIPDTEITSFTQKNIKKNQIKFVSNGIIEAPRYALTVTDPLSSLTDSSVGSTLLVAKNYLPINQNQTFYLTAENLNVTGSSGSATDIIFSPVTVQYSYFALVSDMSFPISTFRQDQVNKNQIAFIPDGSTSEPSCILSVRDSQSGASGSFPCQVDFASYPRLDHAFLKINPPDNIPLTTNNLEAFDDRVPPEQLYFVINDVTNDHFSYSNNFIKPIVNFTQAEISAGRVWFIATTNQPPAFTVTVWNGRLFCQDDCPRAATIIAPDSNPGGLSSLLIGLLSSFGTLVLLPLVKCYFEKAVKAYFSSREDTPDSQVTNEALAQLWIGCCGVITHRQHESYIIAFGHVIDKLNESKQAISLRREWQHLGDRQKREIKSIIAEETKEILVGQQSQFCRFFKSFCSSEATPEIIERQAQQIADQTTPRLSQLFLPARTIPRAPSINNSAITPLLT